MQRDFIDHHCHLLPALDDGSTDPQESLAMARILADFGFSVVHCTPHRIKGCYENEPERVRQVARYLQRQIYEAGINLRLVPSTEHYLDEYLPEQLPDVVTTGLSRYLLVEAPFSSGSDIVPSMLTGLLGSGVIPLVAHPERCNVFDPMPKEGGLWSAVLGRQKKPDLQNSLVASLRDAGCRFQGNLGSFAGYYGTEVKDRAVIFLQHGLYSCVGSDAHRSDRLTHMIHRGFDTIVATVGDAAAVALLRGQGLKG